MMSIAFFFGHVTVAERSEHLSDEPALSVIQLVGGVSCWCYDAFKRVASVRVQFHQMKFEIADACVFVVCGVAWSRRRCVNAVLWVAFGKGILVSGQGVRY